MNLAIKTCAPCRGGVPPLTREEAERFLAEAPGWSLIEAGTKIEKTYRFKNFAEALAHANGIGALAEAEFHHPVVVSFGWGFCGVVLQTKKIKGLHENDFILAAKIDALAGP